MCLAMALARKVLHVVYAVVVRGGMDSTPLENVLGMITGAGNDIATGDKGRPIEIIATTRVVYRRTPPLASSPVATRRLANHDRLPEWAAVHALTVVAR